jgi:hypothetical protein
MLITNDSWKNLMQKISRHCPVNKTGILFTVTITIMLAKALAWDSKFDSRRHCKCTKAYNLLTLSYLSTLSICHTFLNPLESGSTNIFKRPRVTNLPKAKKTFQIFMRSIKTGLFPISLGFKGPGHEARHKVQWVSYAKIYRCETVKKLQTRYWVCWGDFGL